MAALKRRHTDLGGPFVKEISGGERKRTGMAYEILVDPSLLLLDEPTSGLDSTSKTKLLQLQQSIARSGITQKCGGIQSSRNTTVSRGISDKFSAIFMQTSQSPACSSLLNWVLTTSGGEERRSAGTFGSRFLEGSSQMPLDVLHNKFDVMDRVCPVKALPTVGKAPGRNASMI